MKNLVKVLVMVIVGLLTVNLFNSWKESKAIQEWHGSVQDTVDILVDNSPQNLSDKQLLVISHKVTVAYCKENHITSVSDIVLYEETRVAHYHDIGYYDSRSNTIYLNRRINGVVQTLQNADKKEAIDSLLILLGDYKRYKNSY